MIKAIETRYNGYRFRSRLEARWAVFFDALNIKYEPEGFDLGNGMWYLPDFRLPEMGCWIEVKGVEPTRKEKSKCEALAQGTHETVFLLQGQIDSMETAIWIASSLRDDTKKMVKDTWGLFFSFIFVHLSGITEVPLSIKEFKLLSKEMDSTEKKFIELWYFRSWMAFVVKNHGDKFRAACIAARSARFEHGESGAG